MQRPTLSPVPVVAISGTLCDASLWRQVKTPIHPIVAGRLADGRTGAARTMVQYAAELLATLPPRFALAGFSLGGLIALEMVAQAPERIERLAMICAGPGPDSEEGAASRRASESRAAAIGLASHATHDLAPRYGLTAGAALTDIVVAMALAVGLSLYRLQNDLAITRVDSRPRLATMRLPVHLVSGAEDTLCPPARHQEMLALLPNARMTVVSDCGHFVPLAGPAALVEVFRWLSERDNIAKL